ncbi:hypothetical protein FNF31_00651 [Cafeteria roenbergensis]|uniref:Anoctamin transmembrane domain-containing protein n=1 Tax=Cafeteria roenbergensis TaxID=33653 RepID=A0A5A8DQL9_CAFRO|nr:hypothetical protein FNF31_00651 [Cafeteria roenbergensis]
MGPALPPKLPRHQLAIPKLGTRNPCRACVPRLLADILCPLPLDPYSHIYAPLVAEGSPSDPRTSLYYVHKTTGSVLSNSAALRMLVSILEGPTADGGAGAGSLGRLQSSGRLTGWFPGRLVGKEAKLARSWGALVPLCCQPLDQVHSLFGSKVALHFALIAFIASVLVLPALVGAAAFVHQLVVVSPSKVAWAPLFALMVIMLLGVATKLWRRREKRLAMRWGLLNARKKPLLRSEFKQPHRRRRSPITGRPSYLQSARERSTRSCCAASCTATAMGVVVVVTLSTFLARVALGSLEQQGLIEPSWSGYASSVIGAVVVTVTQLLYSRMAVCLTNWENRPTDVEHDASLICKQGVFNAVNVSFALLWTAFAQTRASLIFSGRIEPCSPGPDGSPDCMVQLQAQVASLLLTKFILGNVTEVLLPWLMEHWTHVLCCSLRKCFPRCCWWCCCGCGNAPRHRVKAPAGSKPAEAGASGGTPAAASASGAGSAVALEDIESSGHQPRDAAGDTPTTVRLRGPGSTSSAWADGEGILAGTNLHMAEADADLAAFDPSPEMHEVLAVLTIAVLFVVAFPLAPLVAIVYLASERLVDSDKLLRAASRPLPEDIPSMGSWVALLDAITRAAVVVNAGVVFFTEGRTDISGTSAGFPGLFGAISSSEQRLTAFVAVEACVLGALWLLGVVVSDEPPEVTLQASRQAYLIAKHIHDAPTPSAPGHERDQEEEAAAAVADAEDPDPAPDAEDAEGHADSSKPESARSLGPDASAIVASDVA